MNAGPLVTPEREGRYGLILADPPWRFEARSARRQTKAAPYSTMSRYDLLTMPVDRLAARNCALVMWATQAQLPQALDLMKRWGFDYKSFGTWAKQSASGNKWAFGTGYWFRSAAEIYLVGARGAPLIKSKSERNLIVAPVRQHSRKPEQLREALERMFPLVPKIELFARERREGWDCWGNQLDMFEGAP